jgi:glycosyltransferase involved in cell wall biosynthesis
LRFKVRKLETEKAANKKVLIITYYWPPAGGPGVQRVLKFVKYLPQFGWEPVVLTVKNGEYPAIDHSLEKDIPEGIKVYQTRTIEPFGIFKFLSGKKESIPTYYLNEKGNGLFKWIRFTLFPVDARRWWSFFAIKKGLKIIKNEKPSLIFSSAPPHSINLIARQLKIKGNIPWIADFRDPWINAFWLKNQIKRSFRINSKWEKLCLWEADFLVTISKRYSTLFNSKQQDFHIIPNGFEKKVFPEVTMKKSKSLNIGFFGTWSPLQASDYFFQAIRKAKDLKITINVWGRVSNTVEDKLIKYDLLENFVFHGYVDHDIAIQQMSQVNLLLFLTPENLEEGMIPLKLFEYLGAGVPILGIGNNNVEAKNFIRKTGMGDVFNYEEEEKIVDFLELIKNSPEDIFNPNEEYVNQFEMKNLTQKLVDLFNRA